jgi:hypothetical protein
MTVLVELNFESLRLFCATRYEASSSARSSDEVYVLESDVLNRFETRIATMQEKLVNLKPLNKRDGSKLKLNSRSPYDILIGDNEDMQFTM